MKKVLNKRNSEALQKLNDLLVYPLILALESAKGEGKSVQSCTFFKGLTTEKSKVLSVALLQVVGPNNLTLADGCDELLVALDSAEVTDLRTTFEYQSSELNNGNYSLTRVKYKKAVKKVFADYLYSALFDNAEIWGAIGLPQLTREKFHDNFRLDNDYPAACPYCDMDTINSRGSIKVEHFLPKSKFPLISVHPLNLLSACEACNSGGFGKGSKVVRKLVSPYFEAISDSVQFEFKAVEKILTVKAELGRPGASGFLDLLNLAKRYSEANVGIQYFRSMDAFISTMTVCGTSDLSMIRMYFEKSQGGRPLTVALSHWLENTYIPARVSI